MGNFNSQWDCLTWQSYDFPYNTIERGLSDTPRLVAGSKNTCVTLGGTIAKRYGTTGISGTQNNLPPGSRIDRLWVYETMETNPHVYIVASVAVTNEGMMPLLLGDKKTVWRLYYCNLSGGIYWSLAPALRGSNSSLRPHEACPARGLLLVKSYPSATVDVLGSIILDGTGGTMVTKPWGALGPTTPARMNGVKTTVTSNIAAAENIITVASTAVFPAAPFNIQIDYETITITNVLSGTTMSGLRGAQGTLASAHTVGAYVFYFPWTASAHPVVVNLGWRYSYAYETVTGNVTNRVDYETNPDNTPSDTGPFENLCPQIRIVGQADTTNYPYIRIFRTTDGGDTLFQLARIPNPGAGTFTYTDNSLTSASGNNDPLPDSQLDATIIAPTLTSNSPPPSVISPGVIGVDAIQPSTPIAYFAGRMWYAIGNIVFYSGEEEITLGVPEECWPAGTLGNFFRYQHPVVNLQATSNALYIMTNQDTQVITGNNRTTFNSNPIFQTIGAPVGHPRAVTRYGDSVAWLANDFRIVYAQGANLISLSDELGNDLANAINAGGEVDLTYWANLDKEYIVVLVANPITPSLSREWIFDIKKSTATGQSRQNFWYSPWDVPATCAVSGRLNDTASQRSLIFANIAGGVPYLATYDSTGVAAVDKDATGTVINTYDMIIRFPVLTTPAGNHINALRKPAVAPKVEFIQMDRTAYPSDKDPDVFWYKDDLWTTQLPLPNPRVPDFRKQSRGFNTLKYPVREVCEYMSIQIQKLASPDRYELQNLFIAFDPSLGG